MWDLKGIVGFVRYYLVGIDDSCPEKGLLGKRAQRKFT